MQRLKITYTTKGGQSFKASGPVMHQPTDNEITSAIKNWVDRANRGDIRRVVITLYAPLESN